ncbi:unnamed protein product [Leptosia nina]|uniref:Uncharacterized protein n=1 Tax=Leptosia nina TaxID=320188 RepID=A0AAV1JM27_9NEOP
MVSFRLCLKADKRPSQRETGVSLCYYYKPHGVCTRTTQVDGVSTLDVGLSQNPSGHRPKILACLYTLELHDVIQCRRKGIFLTTSQSFGTISTQGITFQDHVHLIIVPLRFKCYCVIVL